jgi:hypothetical protein
MHPDIENALNEVARDTGRSYRVVEQVFHLQLELARYNGALMMVDGDLTTVSRDGELLPTSLKNEVNDIHDDVVELTDHIVHALQSGCPPSLPMRFEWCGISAPASTGLSE